MITSAKITRLNSMFGPAKEGFRWITLKISGRAAAPADDFKEIYTSTAVAPKEKTVPSDGEGSSFEDLTRPK
jgi:hypothetical protein